MRVRRRALGLKAVTRWVSDVVVVSPYSDHRRLELRSLAMHTLIARKLARDPELLNVARNNLRHWGDRWGRGAPLWHKEWNVILKRPWREVAALITELSPLATRLRQSSPFAGVLTQEERKRIHDAFRA